MTPARRVVVEMSSSKAAWRITPDAAAAIRRAFGRAWDVVEIGVATDSDGDGSGGSPEAVKAVAGAEVYLGYGVSRAVARAGAGTLRWAHSGSAGVGSAITPELRATGAVLTNSAGVHAEPIADWVLAAIGYFFRGLNAAVKAQHDRRWAKDDFCNGSTFLREMTGARVGIIGLGGIGGAVTRRCLGLGMEVRAVRRRRSRGKPKGVRWVGGPREVVRLAGTSDVLVIAAPHTASTGALVDESVLAALPGRALVVNVARGALLDETALLRHLDSGHLAGAALDVFQTEPLPPDHRLWAHPNVLINPHSSDVTDRFWARETALIAENVARYRSGRPLRNVVDLNAGY